MTRHKKQQGNDMRTLGTQLRKGSELVALAADEQALMREHLVSYMEYKPLHRTLPTVAQHVAPSIARRALSSFFGARHLSGALAIALIATMSTYSVSSAAAESLPGDLLYPVKVHVNEGVKTVFVSGDEARIAWERERAEMRLQEAGALASQGRLDDERQEVVAKQFAVHTDALVERVRAVEESDPVLAAEASAEMADALDTQKAVLARLVVEQEESGMVNDGARELVKQIHVAAQEAVVLRDETEANLAFEDDTLVAALPDDEGGATSMLEDVAEVTSISSDEEDVRMPEPDATIASQDSATKERAATRAKARATAGLERAEGLLTARVGESELTTSARAQIDAGVARLGEADAAFAEGRLGSAYSTYRHAASIFQKVAKVLEVSDSLTVDLSASTLIDTMVVEESDTIPGGDGSDPEETTEPAIEDEASQEHTEAMREGDTTGVEQQARTALDLLRTKLDTLHGMPEQHVADARSALKDASASSMNAEIALSLGNTGEAHAIFKQAEGYARRALALLEQYSEINTDIASTTEEGVPTEEVPVSPINPMPEGDALVITHTFEEWIHTFGGVITLDTCTSAVRAEVVTTEPSDSQLTLAFTTEPVERNGACGKQGVSFRATTSAAEEAMLVDATLDGEQIYWVVSEPEDMVEVPEVHGASTTNGSTSMMFRRAFEGAQGLFSR